MTIVRPDKKVINIWRILLVLVSLVPTLIMALLLKGSSYYIGVTIWLIFFLIVFLAYIPLFYKNLIYIVNDDTISIKTGVLYSNYYSIPIDKIQFTSIILSPFSRLFGLVSLRIAAPGAKLLLSGLDLKEARAFSKMLSTKKES